ncbi:M16 family metallopeptidase [Pelobium manganitolerans]|uniref:M16 family metallopeptidase n=1 Tax=Pelobium manganitolerans TaxID=1842495 RepID=UPI003FA347B0
MRSYQIIQLANGIRILLQPAKSVISHCCLVINAGSRDEEVGAPGLAHFIEHLLFKQTLKRNTTQILNRLELVGGDLNAYTTKEYTCLQASFLKPHLERAMELLQDIAFCSTFPESEMEKEKEVVLDEILSYEDQPEEAINDDFESMLFTGHTLGENILGTPQSVKSFRRQQLMDFIAKNYNTHEMVFAISGPYTLAKVQKLAERYFGQIPENRSVKHRVSATQNPAKQKTVFKPINQAHCMLGTVAYDIHSPKKPALLLLNNILGGTGMSSRLNLEIREKYGIAYTIESNYSPLTDTGLFSIYFGTDAEKVEKALALIHKEIYKLSTQALGKIQLSQAKKRFTGQIALGEENRMGVLISMAKSLLDYGKIDSLKEIYEKINAVSAQEILAASNELLAPENLSLLLYQPEQ